MKHFNFHKNFCFPRKLKITKEYPKNEQNNNEKQQQHYLNNNQK